MAGSAYGMTSPAKMTFSELSQYFLDIATSCMATAGRQFM
jgi:hypothetical protein